MSLVWLTWTLSLLPALLAGQGLALAGTQSPDSALVVQRVRQAQMNFEQRRRACLPVSLGHLGTSCDERIGRFCYWYEDAGASPPQEPRRIGEARDRLLERGMAETQHNIGISWRDLRVYARALDAAEEAVRLALQVGDEALAALAVAGRAELHLIQGDAELAGVELARAGAAFERLQHPGGLAEVWRLQAGVARSRGDVEGAVALLRRAAALLAKGPGSAPTLAEIERDLGTALVALGDEAGARAARSRAAELYRRLGAARAADAVGALGSGGG